MSIYTDSLRRKNKELNRRLSELVVYLDKQVQNAFSHREQQMNNAWKVSHRLMTGVFTVAVILLLVSYLIIQKDIVTREKNSKG
jgi:type VI protein secretion system component VasF